MKKEKMKSTKYNSPKKKCNSPKEKCNSPKEICNSPKANKEKKSPTKDVSPYLFVREANVGVSVYREPESAAKGVYPNAEICLHGGKVR